MKKMKMKKTVLALALTLTCGSFLGFLPGKTVMAAEAAPASVSGGDFGSSSTENFTLSAPTNLRWVEYPTPEGGLNLDALAELIGGSTLLGYSITCDFTHDYAGVEGHAIDPTGDAMIELEIYRDDELVGTTQYVANVNIYGSHVGSSKPILAAQRSDLDAVCDRFSEIVRRPMFDQAGTYKVRARAISICMRKSNGYYWSTILMNGFSVHKVYSDWSDWSPEFVYEGKPAQEDGSSAGDVDNTAADNDTEPDGEPAGNDTVTTSSGGVLASSAAVNVTGGASAVIRTSQSAVNAAAASAVGGLKEGQYVVATVGDSACGGLARQAVTNAAGSVNAKVASYLEITLDVCNQGGGVAQNVTKLSAPIEFTISAPADIDGSRYDFAVVRLHDGGQVDILRDLDNDPATITFQTDRFSVYAVIYGDKGAFSKTGKDSVPKTGDGTLPVLPFAVTAAACVAAVCILKRKERA